MTKQEKHGIPALLSVFLPGLGQLIKGDVKKGLTYIGFTILAAFMCLFLIGFFLYPIVVALAAMDAYNTPIKEE